MTKKETNSDSELWELLKCSNVSVNETPEGG